MDDAFVTKFNPSGSALVYSTYLGGGSEDDPYALAIDQAGNVYITGRTNSSDFPLTNPIQNYADRVRHVRHRNQRGRIGPAVFDVHRRLRERVGPRHRRGPLGQHTHRRGRHVHGFSGEERVAGRQRRRQPLPRMPWCCCWAIPPPSNGPVDHDRQRQSHRRRRR